MSQIGYYSSPSIFEKNLVFISDDDIWKMNTANNQCVRLTTLHGVPQNPLYSPNGQMIAYSSNDSGDREIYLISHLGGMPKRLTYFKNCSLIGWKNNQTILFRSTYESFHKSISYLYSMNILTSRIEKINIGPGSIVLYGNEKQRVLGRNIGDPARWKRYRGGTAGTLWVDKKGNNDFKQILRNLKTNLSNPLIMNNRIFFISDHEGIGKIYSCNMSGTNLKVHSSNVSFYVRSFSIDNNKIIYASEGKLFFLDIKQKETIELKIELNSNFNQAQTRFENASDYLSDFSLSEDKHKISITARGQIFSMYPWSKSPLRLGDKEKRYKMSFHLAKTSNILAIELNQNNEEEFVLISSKKLNKQTIPSKKSFGKVWTTSLSPCSNYFAFSTNRNQLWVLNLKTRKFNKVDDASKLPLLSVNFSKISWSPCSQFITYSTAIDNRRSGIKVYHLESKSKKNITSPILHDWSPVFCPSGKYIYFLGIREFYPVYNETHFELGFPYASRPYIIILDKEEKSPLDHCLEITEENDDEDKKQKLITKINYEDIESRVLPVPIRLGGYIDLIPTKNKLLYLKEKTTTPNPATKVEYGDDNLYQFSFKTLKEELFHDKIDDYSLSIKNDYILLRTHEKFRLISTDEKPNDEDDAGRFNKRDGWIDMTPVSLKIDPRKEWKQIYQEAWILQREHFWNKQMSSINWKNIYLKYLPLVDRINTRSEFSDLLWEMQGELGTSHCYEFDGDYHKLPNHEPLGQLGAKLEFNPKNKSYKIIHIHRGNSWDNNITSPLSNHYVQLNHGDHIIDLDGEKFHNSNDIYALLNNKGSKKISLLIKQKNSKTTKRIYTQTLPNQMPLLYRAWVENNKNIVHKKTNGKVGYVHIPDMSTQGFAEFYRGFLSESGKDGLIVDVRFNGGGNVSQHILKILAQKTLGYDFSRWGATEKFPSYSTRSKITCITNELAGSDGDIFSHSFKMLKLGKLIGKRTWGGVIGIWPRNELNDGTITTQPEYSFWFNDVGYNIENKGTEPDIKVEITPKDWSNNKDTQLDKAIIESMKELKKIKPISKHKLKIPTLGQK